MNELDKLQRLNRLARLVEKVGGTLEGRKKLHKLVYLCQDRGIDFGQDFVFHQYGVFSPGLADDLQQAVKWDVLREERVDSGEKTTYRISLGTEAQPHFSEWDATFVAPLAEESAATLEVLGAIVYLARHGYEGTELLERLRSLKGHLSNHFDRSLDMAATYFDIRL